VKVFNGIDEVEQAVGTHLGYSEWHTVTQEQVDKFADATEDHQWIHVDTEKAGQGPFRTTIAHGFLTLSLMPKLLGEIYEVKGLKMGVNYGSNKIRFPSPVPTGSKIRGGVELVSLEPGAGGYVLTAQATVEIHGAQKPACVAEVLSVLVPVTEVSGRAATPPNKSAKEEL
jgi:acyl dehydratase